jgi:hypothetical protein
VAVAVVRRGGGQVGAGQPVAIERRNPRQRASVPHRDPAREVETFSQADLIVVELPDGVGSAPPARVPDEERWSGSKEAVMLDPEIAARLKRDEHGLFARSAARKGATQPRWRSRDPFLLVNILITRKYWYSGTPKRAAARPKRHPPDG